MHSDLRYGLGMRLKQRICSDLQDYDKLYNAFQQNMLRLYSHVEGNLFCFVILLKEPTSHGEYGTKLKAVE